MHQIRQSSKHILDWSHNIRRIVSNTTRSFSNHNVTTPLKTTLRAVITGLNHEGDAIGHATISTGESTIELPLIIPFAVPGDTLDVSLYSADIAHVLKKFQNRKSDELGKIWPLYASIESVVQPSVDRLPVVRCPSYFKTCGGCKHQHIEYRQQLAQKQQRIETLFKHFAIPINSIIGVENDLYHYRNKVELTSSTGEWLMPHDVENERQSEVEELNRSSFALGFFPTASVYTKRMRSQKHLRRRRIPPWNGRVVSIETCQLQVPLCNHILQRFQSLCREYDLPAYDHHIHQGFLKQFVLRRGMGLDGVNEIMLGIVTSTWQGTAQAQLEKLIIRLVAELEVTETKDKIVSVVQQLDPEALRHRRRQGESIAVEKELELGNERLLYGQSFYHDTILNHRFAISFNAFFQPNTAQATALYRAIAQELQQSRNENIVLWDLFCGVGSIGICMGPYVSKVIGLEVVEPAVARARDNALLNGYDMDKMSFHSLDLSTNWEMVRIQLDTLPTPDVVIVDPPRAGLHKKLVKLLRDTVTPKRICYVSCNPETQVRDLGWLIETQDYCIDLVQPVDMLPHTPHIETLVWLTRTQTK